MFPTATSVVDYNEAGEPVGWDTPTDWSPAEEYDYGDDWNESTFNWGSNPDNYPRN